MLFSSPIFAKASGSINGMTFSHNRGGQYTRCRSVPTNPQTSFQSAIRDAMSCLVVDWNDTLTQAQRDAWDTYGDNVPVTNRIGNQTNLTGQNWFVGNNIPRVAQGESAIVAAPTTFNQSYGGDLSTSQVKEGAALEFSIDTAGDWTDQDGGKFFVQQGIPQNAGSQFYGGPYRTVGVIDGDATTPPTTISIAAVDLAFALTEGQRVKFRLRGQPTDGRLSSPIFLSAIVAAAS